MCVAGHHAATHQLSFRSNRRLHCSRLLASVSGVEPPPATWANSTPLQGRAPPGRNSSGLEVPPVSAPLLGRRQAEIESGTELTSSFVGKKSFQLGSLLYSERSNSNLPCWAVCIYSNPSIHSIARLLAICVRACAKSTSFSYFWGAS